MTRMMANRSLSVGTAAEAANRRRYPLTNKGDSSALISDEPGLSFYQRMSPIGVDFNTLTRARDKTLYLPRGISRSRTSIFLPFRGVISRSLQENFLPYLNRPQRSNRGKLHWKECAQDTVLGFGGNKSRDALKDYICIEERLSHAKDVV